MSGQDKQTTGPAVKQTGDPYLPDFCNPRMVLGVVLICELLAIVLTMARQDAVQDFWVDLARISLFVLWVGLCTAWVLCVARKRLAGLRAPLLSLASFALMLATTLALAEITWWVGEVVMAPVSEGLPSFFPLEHGSFLLRSVIISGIASALVLRYFYVSHQWRSNVEMEARSRVSALQARIRPHFLFNSMNTIASLTRSNPEVAEQAVEDLADLFRASLADARHRIPLKQELEMARIYQRIEQLRLGERLKVRWDVKTLPMRTPVPALIVQPLLENAIYHGIEPLAEGGTVAVSGERYGDMLRISVTNPVPAGAAPGRRDGNRMALDNIRERLTLAYGRRARVDIDAGAESFSVSLVFPYTEEPG